MNWKTAAGCIGTAAALATVAGVLAVAQAYQPAVRPLLFGALVLIGVGALIVLVGLLWSVFSFVRGLHVFPKRMPKPRPASTPLVPAPDKSPQLRMLQGLLERGRTIQMQIPAGVFTFIRPVAEQAESWHRDVQLALDPIQQRRFTEAGGQFRTGGSAELVDSMRHYIHALEEIINSMCVVLQPAKEFHATN